MFETYLSLHGLHRTDADLVGRVRSGLKTSLILAYRELSFVLVHLFYFMVSKKKVVQKHFCGL